MKTIANCSSLSLPLPLRLIVALALLGSTVCLSCAPDRTTDKHAVYFVGYIYDGASGKRLTGPELTAISLKYRDQTIHTKIDSDGRYVSVEPLPTWQDYSVYVGAAGYRPFVSNNPGIDVPKSLSMTDGLAGTTTVQTFQFDAYLFPVALTAPKISVSIEKSDAAVVIPAPARASGTIRLRPQTSSLLDRSAVASDPSGLPLQRRWDNDEDLLNQTIAKPFTDGMVDFAEGELVYGVAYEMAVFDVDGYQPLVRSGQLALLAGSVTSLFVTLQVDAKVPLRVLSTDADACLPPAPTAADFGATINVTFSEEIEAADASFAESIDNGLSVSLGTGSSTFSTCALKMSVDPTRQERGSRAVINGNVLSLAFNPSQGLASVSSAGTTCTPPRALAAVVYGNLGGVFIQPKKDPVRKRTLAAMLAELPGSSQSFLSSLSCPSHVTSSF